LSKVVDINIAQHKNVVRRRTMVHLQNWFGLLPPDRHCDHRPLDRKSRQTPCAVAAGGGFRRDGASENGYRHFVICNSASFGTVIFNSKFNRNGIRPQLGALLIIPGHV